MPSKIIFLYPKRLKKNGINNRQMASENCPNAIFAVGFGIPALTKNGFAF
jgi:hypothetical protein